MATRLCSNLGGIDPEKPYRATFNQCGYFKLNFRCQNPYFELDVEQDAMRKHLLIQKSTE